MSLKISSRHEWVRKSELRAMSDECEWVGGVNLSQGVCNLAVPEPVVRAAKEAIDRGQNSYSRHDGTGPLRRACRRGHTTCWQMYLLLPGDDSKERAMFLLAQTGVASVPG